MRINERIEEMMNESLELTCVGLAFSLGKLILVGFSCSVDGLLGVGGSRRPIPARRDASVG